MRALDLHETRRLAVRPRATGLRAELADVVRAERDVQVVLAEATPPAGLRALAVQARAGGGDAIQRFRVEVHELARHLALSARGAAVPPPVP